MLFQPFDREEAALRQCRINSGPCMSLAEDESVAARPVGMGGIEAHDSAIKHSHDIRHRKDRSDVRAASEIRHAHRVPPNSLRQLLCGSSLNRAFWLMRNCCSLSFNDAASTEK